MAGFKFTSDRANRRYMSVGLREYGYSKEGYGTIKPKVRFIAKSGLRFTKVFRTRASAARALLGWRKAGGKIFTLRNV